MGQAKEPHTIIKPQERNTGEMGYILQTTLDVYELLKQFHHALQERIAHHSFDFKNTETGHGLTLGSPQSYEALFQLRLEDQSLGEIQLTKTTVFTPTEQVVIENALAQLIYPLRNAIQYHAVVIHSVTDPLTRLGNRALFDQTIHREIDLAVRHQGHFGLLLMDIDNFKQINDREGHLAGDVILRELGKIISQLKRNSDYVFRYGGEEFIFILSHSKDSSTVAERIRQQIAHHDFCYQGKRIPVTVSMGLTHFYPQDNFDTLFQRADRALYCAKDKGKNQVCML
jgi:diguanylate cyclase (GGDEF)-like protein